MMRDWYLRQSPRDRMIVNAVAVLALLGLLYALVWYPLTSRIEQTRSAIATKEETLDYVREGAARLMGSIGGGEARQSDKEPYLLINDVIVAQGVELPERLEPAGQNGARVQFSAVEFDKLVQVIAELELYGLDVDTLNITRKTDQPGIVSARFVMEKAS
ncbi:MAG: hypothetical protein CSB44_08450 [Gammaproteobacteria bacterium]|nr:MAG: hypothetical protein CSB44_08450 [Gammaproteobacteria bacterium]PIE36669.1 MAG: hypothetical protein CSA54_03750 [Gammaproteobacteria bacterium]